MINHLCFSGKAIIPPVAPYTGGKLGMESGGSDTNAGKSPSADTKGRI